MRSLQRKVTRRAAAVSKRRPWRAGGAIIRPIAASAEGGCTSSVAVRTCRTSPTARAFRHRTADRTNAGRRQAAHEKQHLSATAPVPRKNNPTASLTPPRMQMSGPDDPTRIAKTVEIGRNGRIMPDLATAAIRIPVSGGATMTSCNLAERCLPQRPYSLRRIIAAAADSSVGQRPTARNFHRISA